MPYCNNKRFTTKFAIIIHLKIICHVRIGITPSETRVYAEFYHGLNFKAITSNHGKNLRIPWFGQGLFLYYANLATNCHLMKI